MKISSILATKSHEIITIGPEQSLQDMVELLVRHNIGALPVLDEHGKLIGIISERDVIRHIAKSGSLGNTAVHTIMTRNVVVGVPQDDIISVANTMTERRFRHLPIVEGDRLIGIISIGDILKAQRDTYRGEIDTLETQIMAGEVG